MDPVAEYNLETFLRRAAEDQDEGPSCDRMKLVRHLHQFIICLSNTLAYVHQQLVKHMDIKPQNILVRGLPARDPRTTNCAIVKPIFKVYLADFGIARSYTSSEATETEGPTLFTRKYAAPEVVDRDRRGLAADIFSLGCVFAEMAATMAVWNSEGERHDARLRNILRTNEFGDQSYQANIDGVRCLMESMNKQRLSRDSCLWNEIVCMSDIAPVVITMLDKDPSKRPSARAITKHWAAMHWKFGRRCCNRGPDELEAIPSDAVFIS